MGHPVSASHHFSRASNSAGTETKLDRQALVPGRRGFCQDAVVVRACGRPSESAVQWHFGRRQEPEYTNLQFQNREFHRPPPTEHTKQNLVARLISTYLVKVHLVSAICRIQVFFIRFPFPHTLVLVSYGAGGSEGEKPISAAADALAGAAQAGSKWRV